MALETDDLSILEKAGRALLDSAGAIVHGIPSLEFAEPDYPSTAVVLDVAGRCQVSTYTCGITSTWSIITALGSKVRLREWYGRCHKAGCHPGEGMDIDQIAKALRSLRLKVATKRYTGKAQIKKFIDEGQPILFGQGHEHSDDGHWMYIYGYSPRFVYVGNVVNPLYPIGSKEAWGLRRFESELDPRELYIINS